MTDNETLRPEDFEPHRVDPGSGTVRPKFADVWKEQPLLRLAIVLLPVIAVVVLVVGVFGSSKPVVAPSKISNGSTLQTPGNGLGTEAYNNAVKDVNKQRLDNALQTGASNIPTQIGTPAATDEAPVDPLAEFRTPIAPPPPVTATQAPNYTAAPVQKPVDPALVQSLTAEMRAIISTPASNKIVITRVVQDQPQQQQANAQPQAPVATREGTLIVTAGTVVYGQLLTEADSDIPAPILVSVLSGPFQGGRAIGTFQKTPDYLVLAFGTIIKDKKEYKVNALAIDPETTLTGLETSTDHHYFERFVLPAAAGFISGIGQYAEQAGSTSTYSTYGITQTSPPLNTHQEVLAGLGNGANAIANAIQQESNVQPTIHVAAGTPIGIMFINSVHENNQ